MAILAGDVKLVASQVMDDVPEGGGGPTSNVIPDGGSNNIFNDISEADRAGGRVNLRKVHVHVQTNDRDTYLGANLIVADPPNDPNVSITLMRAQDTFDERSDAANRIESYLYKGPVWGGYLFENHIAGQRVIQVFQRLGQELPADGQTLVLVYREDFPDQREQYVRVTRVTAVERVFTYLEGATPRDYTANVVSVEISDPLRDDFPGSPASRTFQPTSSATRIRDTVVADASTYAGVVPLAQPAEIGDFSVNTEGIYTQLVPNAQTEVPALTVSPWGDQLMPLAGLQDVSYTTSQTWNTSIALQLPSGLLPGTLSVTVGGATIIDEGGKLVQSGGQVGTVDYDNGTLALLSGSLDGAKSITFRPAAFGLRQPQSAEIPVTIESRSLSYVGTLDVPPPLGTLGVHFMVQGRWYVLKDDGSGALKGFDSSHGAGTYSPSTGGFVVTLGALPDVGSSIIITWGVKGSDITLEPETMKAFKSVSLPTLTGGVDRSSLTLTWTTDGSPKTASSDAQGFLTGDATGYVASNGGLVFEPNVLPAENAVVSADYDMTFSEHRAVVAAVSGENWTFSAPTTPVTPGSLYISLNILGDTSLIDPDELKVYLLAGSFLNPKKWLGYDDGVGNIRNQHTKELCGTVNYATGLVTLTTPPVYPTYVPLVSPGKPLWGAGVISEGGWVRSVWAWGSVYRTFVATPVLVPDSGTIRYHTSSTNEPTSHAFDWTASLNLFETKPVAQVVPRSVVVRQAGSSELVSDNGASSLFHINSSGVSEPKGTISYVNGALSLEGFAEGSTGSFDVLAAELHTGDSVASTAIFRTAAAPLRPGSFSIQFVREGGVLQTVNADTNGVLSATGLSGTVDHQTGLVRLYFGTLVPAAGNESKPWYSPDNVDGDGNIWRPEPVATSTLRYNAVAFSYLPLDATILGIDPVRLPSDGRVPIFRAGGFAVVGNTQQTATQNVSNLDVIDTGRTRLSRVRVIGSDGETINTGYTADLEAGTVTFSDVSGYEQPVRVEHRIEDMVLVNDVQINGQVTFTRPLTHDYPASGTFVSSAIVAGDVRARTSLVFDQNTWTNVWQDTPIGAGATAQYNDIDYPIVVTNAGALTERWALVFTSTTSFNILGEHLGVIGTGSINSTTSPVNTITGQPYFTIPEGGWGAGWATGNVLRINTIGAQVPVWIARTIQPGPEAAGDYSFELLVRGDVDAPAP